MHHLKSSEGSLSLNVIREICSYVQDPRLFVAIYAEKMQLFDIN